MASATKERHFRSVEEERENELFDLLESRHPETRELIVELSNLVGTLMNQAEERGVRRHGEQILQMIEGSRYQFQQCMPPSVEVPGDEEEGQ